MQKKDLDKLPTPVTEPVLVAPNGKPFEDCQLKLQAYFTSGEGEWHYNLTMLDKDGNPLQPGNHGSNVWVYLPFPEGHQSGQRYKLNHYVNGLYDQSNLNAQEEITVQETLYGLMFETDSFSPFILSKAEGAAPSSTNPPAAGQQPDVPVQQPPKAGDDMPLLWLAALAAVSLAGLMILRRRAKP